MDPIGTSCFSLHIDDKERALLEEKQQELKFQEIIVSCKSLSKYEAKTWKTTLPQLIATAIVASYHIVIGIAMAYSAILVAQLRNDKDFLPTENEQAWLASIIIVANPIGSVIAGLMMDRIGRLNTLKMAALPGLIGWSVIALATNVPMILCGRFLTGISTALGTSPAIVYITEIARADMRGSLISFAPSYASLGMVIAYFLGYLMRWSIVAWIANAFSLVPIILLLFIPESPPWLITKGRIEEAGKSLAWLHKYQPKPDNKNQTLAEMQLDDLQKKHEKRLFEESKHSKGFRQKAAEFIKPTGYKPLLILFGLFFVQQFAGIYITLFYSVVFFETVGSKMNPYRASILIGSVRLAMSIVNTYMLRTFRRRPLVIWSCLGMSACMAVSGLFTHLIKNGSSTLTWVPVTSIILYVVTSMIGLLPIPWTITAEVFPIEIRGLAHSLSYGMANIIMFAAIQSYYSLDELLGGAAGIQWFFAGVSLVGLLYTVVFMPETHGKKLEENVDYFRHNTIYLCRKETPKQKSKASNVLSRTGKKDIVKSLNEQSEKLMNNV